MAKSIGAYPEGVIGKKMQSIGVIDEVEAQAFTLTPLGYRVTRNKGKKHFFTFFGFFSLPPSALRLWETRGKNRRLTSGFPKAKGTGGTTESKHRHRSIGVIDQVEGVISLCLSILFWGKAFAIGHEKHRR